jgi:hypothetical protein
MAKHRKHDSGRHRQGPNAAFQEAMDAKNTSYEASQRASGMASHYDAKSHAKTNPQGQRRAGHRDRG